MVRSVHRLALSGGSDPAAAASARRTLLVRRAVRRADARRISVSAVHRALSPPARGAGGRRRLLGLRVSGQRHRAATGRSPARRYVDGGGPETVRQVLGTRPVRCRHEPRGWPDGSAASSGAAAVTLHAAWRRELDADEAGGGAPPARNRRHRDRGALSRRSR